MGLGMLRGLMLSKEGLPILFMHLGGRRWVRSPIFLCSEFLQQNHRHVQSDCQSLNASALPSLRAGCTESQTRTQAKTRRTIGGSFFADVIMSAPAAASFAVGQKVVVLGRKEGIIRYIGTPAVRGGADKLGGPAQI